MGRIGREQFVIRKPNSVSFWQVHPISRTVGCCHFSHAVHSLWLSPLGTSQQENRKEVQNYASDFYPSVIIRNIFRDLIICIFFFRVKSIKGGLIPCSTVLTKCFHIFFQLDSLFHFWKILCNYFLMLLKTHKFSRGLVASALFYWIMFHLIVHFINWKFLK